jgi:hypothetical protein
MDAVVYTVLVIALCVSAWFDDFDPRNFTKFD